MIRSSVKELMCEDARLEQLMNIPISDILYYRDMANSVDPEEALCFLADKYIDECESNSGLWELNAPYYYCADYWIEKLDLKNNPALNKKYHSASTLVEIIPYISERYYDGLLKEHDTCPKNEIEIRETMVDWVFRNYDDKYKVIICAGLFHYLSHIQATHDMFWLDQFPIEHIERSIIYYENRKLIRYRHFDDFQRFYRWKHRKNQSKQGHRHIVENWPDEFTDEEVAHFIVLNDRLVELQHEVMDQVKVITANLQEQIEKGFHQYDTFCIDGYIIIELYEKDVENELLETLCQFAQYNVIHANDNTPSELLTDEINEERHWYANWSGTFHPLEKSHGLKLCSAFRYLFEEAKIFTISDIMKINPEMLLPDIKINI